jgi:hypothetical protein
MKKKLNKEFMRFLNEPLKITINENLKPSKPAGAIARKIEEANEHLSKIKNLDKISNAILHPNDLRRNTNCNFLRGLTMN